MPDNLCLDRFYLTDSGLETDLVFNQGIDLPCFAAFPLLRDADGRRRLDTYFRRHLAVAAGAGTGFLLESVTWRANLDWAGQLGIDAATLDALNRKAIEMLKALRDEYATPALPILISGCIGPRGDGYIADTATDIDADIAAARAYHSVQIASLAAAGPDLVSAITMTNVPEAIGVALAARAAGLPVVVSFTLETDGRLPSGAALVDAIAAVDAATDGYPSWFMINCAHPSHFAALFETPAPWHARIGGLRANASCLSHAELDVMTSLDAGDPAALARDYAMLAHRLPGLRVLGGCCGTDARHVAAIAQACAT
jgi:S-methylmethionine-dependent homocysteine/selenocysteine methylase